MSYLCQTCKYNNNGWCNTLRFNGLKKQNIQDCNYYKDKEKEKDTNDLLEKKSETVTKQLFTGQTIPNIVGSVSGTTLEQRYTKVYIKQHELERALFELENKIFQQSLISTPVLKYAEEQGVMEAFTALVNAWKDVLAKDGVNL